uniref:Uncharacterized protein n=1 Tax=Helobdella robusta TaxID=6412 RepID=T1FXH4_HELRO
MSGRLKEENVLLQRIPMISTDLPFNFKRPQFPSRLAFAITKPQSNLFMLLVYI